MSTDPVIVVTGTDTGVGKTVVTAALAVTLGRALGSERVHVHKPAQTGVAKGEPGDVALVARLAGLPPEQTSEGVRLVEPLAPTTAARRAGVSLPSVADQADRIAGLRSSGRRVLVEGAGGVLVGLDDDGATLLDLAAALAERGIDCSFVVVARSGLGTLNHTRLTCEAIGSRGLDLLGVVIGELAPEPDLATRCNLDEIALVAGTVLLGALPAACAALPAGDFRHVALASLPTVLSPVVSHEPLVSQEGDL